MRIDSASFLPLLLPHVCRNMATRIKLGAFEFLGSVLSGDFHLANGGCYVVLSWALSFWKDETNQQQLFSPQFLFSTSQLKSSPWDSESWQCLITLSRLSPPGTSPLIQIYLPIRWVNHSPLPTQRFGTLIIAADRLQIPVLATTDRSSPQGYSEKPPLTGKGSERSLVAARVQRISDGCGPSLKQGTSTTPLGLRGMLWKRKAEST